MAGRALLRGGPVQPARPADVSLDARAAGRPTTNHAIGPTKAANTTMAAHTTVAVVDSPSVCRAIETSASTISTISAIAAADQTRSYKGGRNGFAIGADPSMCTEESMADISSRVVTNVVNHIRPGGASIPPVGPSESSIRAAGLSRRGSVVHFTTGGEYPHLALRRHFGPPMRIRRHGPNLKGSGRERPPE